jgi:O-methyltransferase involved in polyketide biosynthesis
MPGSESISPTAHYTGAVWGHYGLAPSELVTTEGRAMRLALQPTLLFTRIVGAPDLDGFLLARHRTIDRLLEEAIADGRVGQVIEIAAGMSPRGWRFAEQVTYVEGDLPGMAARKRDALARTGASHEVVELDALHDDGPDSLAAVASALDPQQGLAIITEGLLNYLDRDAVLGLWRRIATTLQGFPDGLYLSDLVVDDDVSGLVPRAFSAALSVFVRSPIHLHFANDGEARRELERAGFGRAVLHRPAEVVRVVDARPR